METCQALLSNTWMTFSGQVPTKCRRSYSTLEMNSWRVPKEKVFTYLESEIEQVGESIIVSQENYIEEKLLEVPQTGTFRTILGRLNWFAAQTRPDICYLVSDWLQRIKSRKNAHHIIKLLRNLKFEKKHGIRFPPQSLEQCQCLFSLMLLSATTTMVRHKVVYLYLNLMAIHNIPCPGSKES